MCHIHEVTAVLGPPEGGVGQRLRWEGLPSPTTEHPERQGV